MLTAGSSGRRDRDGRAGQTPVSFRVGTNAFPLNDRSGEPSGGTGREPPRDLHVLAHLSEEIVHRVVPLRGAEALHELEADVLAVQIPVEIEHVGLDPVLLTV